MLMGVHEIKKSYINSYSTCYNSTGKRKLITMSLYSIFFILLFFECTILLFDCYSLEYI